MLYKHQSSNIQDRFQVEVGLNISIYVIKAL